MDAEFHWKFGVSVMAPAYVRQLMIVPENTTLKHSVVPPEDLPKHTEYRVFTGMWVVPF